MLTFKVTVPLMYGSEYFSMDLVRSAVVRTLSLFQCRCVA